MVCATDEKSLNRLRPLFSAPCCMSSMRWAGITICFFIMSAKEIMAPLGSLRGQQALKHSTDA